MDERNGRSLDTERAETDCERQPLFALGQIMATLGAVRACDQAEVHPVAYVNRHLFGDWGDLDEEDKRANEHALAVGARLLSAYDLPTDDRLWIITEADRSVTTLLLPLEY
jgi:hypothetical protein